MADFVVEMTEEEEEEGGGGTDGSISNTSSGVDVVTPPLVEKELEATKSPTEDRNDNNNNNNKTEDTKSEDNLHARILQQQQEILASNARNAFTTAAQVPMQHDTPTESHVDSSCSPQRNVLMIDIPAKKAQDRGRHWYLPPRLQQTDRDTDTRRDIDIGVYIYAVSDGHGRRGESVAETVMCSLDEALTQQGTAATAQIGGGGGGVDWAGEQDLQAALEGLFRHAEEQCAGLFGDYDGGATLSVCVDRPGRDLWVAHVGDSDVCLLDLAGGTEEEEEQQQQGGGMTLAPTVTVLTEDHSPLSMPEFLRMVTLCPSARFEYDRQRKDAPILHIYAACPETEGGWRRNPVPKRNVYYKNRANDLATYVSEGLGGQQGCSSLANTRAIGDFRMKRAVGLTAAPFVARHPPLSPSQRLVLASDGFWDSWPVQELLQFCEERRDFCTVVASLESTHVTTTNKYFGSCSDDTFLFFVQPSDL